MSGRRVREEADEGRLVADLVDGDVGESGIGVLAVEARIGSGSELEPASSACRSVSMSSRGPCSSELSE